MMMIFFLLFNVYYSMFISLKVRTGRIRFSYNYSMSFTYIADSL